MCCIYILLICYCCCSVFDLLMLFGDVCCLGGCDVRTGIVVIARMSCDI